MSTTPSLLPPISNDSMDGSSSGGGNPVLNVKMSPGYFDVEGKNGSGDNQPPPKKLVSDDIPVL